MTASAVEESSDRSIYRRVLPEVDGTKLEVSQHTATAGD